MSSLFVRFIFGIGLLMLSAPVVNGQWVKTAGPEGANIGALAISGATLFAGTSDSGIFISDNDGASWKKVNSGLTNQYINALVVKGSNVFAGTYGGGVFISTNNGTNWTAVNNGLPYTLDPQNVPKTIVACLAVRDSSIFAGISDSGIYLSTNNGTDWIPRNNGLTNKTVVSLAICDSLNVFAGTYNGGVFLSMDNGAGWTAVNKNFPFNPYIFSPTYPQVLSVAVKDKYVFAGTWGCGILSSTDNGKSWVEVNQGLSNTNIKTLAVIGNTIIAGTFGNGVFQSVDNGTNWTAFNTGLMDNNAVSFVIKDTNIFAGTSGSGVWIRSISDMVGTAKHETHQIVPVADKCKINFPGHTGSILTIEFSTARLCKVKLTIYNLFGTAVAMTDNNYYEAGRHISSWDTRTVVPGYYIARIRIGLETFDKYITVCR
jgi:photosystem II stability/assembly factor-like uncharacterized protein